MNATVGWLLAAVAVAVGYFGYGWGGVVLAVSVVVFWLLLQFSRAVRVMRDAAGRPVGTVDSAVMLQARLHKGQTLAQMIKLTRSLGEKRGDDPERYAWTDPAGDAVQVTLRDGRLSEWQLVRAAPAPVAES